MLRNRLILKLLALGFASVSLSACSQPAICDGTAEARDALNAALLVDGGDQSVVAGAQLLSIMDAGCRS
jgi:hypothetical protein